jgi:hypothetical protein
MMDCKQLVEKIRSGEQGTREAMEELYQDKKLQKAAYYWFNRFPRLKSIFKWEDIFSEAILRFINAVLSEKRKAKPIKDCQAFFKGILNNLVQELDRLLREGQLPEDYKLDEAFQKLMSYSGQLQGGHKLDIIFELLKSFLDQLSPQCRLLMYLLFFHHPPYDPKDRVALAEILREHGYDVAPDSIPATISRCKRKFIDLIRDNLDDFDDLDL